MSIRKVPEEHPNAIRWGTRMGIWEVKLALDSVCPQSAN
jgi:hypothetical protein